MSADALDALVKLSAYREGREHVFPSAGSLTWFARIHRAELVKARALLMVAGQWYANARLFDAYMFEHGEEQALKALAQSNDAAAKQQLQAQA